MNEEGSGLGPTLEFYAILGIISTKSEFKSFIISIFFNKIKSFS
jgi:hypothetical protein